MVYTKLSHTKARRTMPVLDIDNIVESRDIMVICDIPIKGYFIVVARDEEKHDTHECDSARYAVHTYLSQCFIKLLFLAPIPSLTETKYRPLGSPAISTLKSVTGE
jgi:hypothetical protein